MRMTVTSIQGVRTAFTSVSKLRAKLNGMIEDANGDLVQLGPLDVIDARLAVKIEGIDAATFASFCELVETAGGRISIAQEAL